MADSRPTLSASPTLASFAYVRRAAYFDSPPLEPVLCLASRSAFMTWKALVSGAHHLNAMIRMGGPAPNQNRLRQPSGVVGTSARVNTAARR